MNRHTEVSGVTKKERDPKEKRVALAQRILEYRKNHPKVRKVRDRVRTRKPQPPRNN